MDFLGDLFSKAFFRDTNPAVFRQILAGLLIVAAMFVVAAATSHGAGEQPVQENQEFGNAFFPI